MIDYINLIRTHRKRLNLKQTDMAERLNMNLLAYQRLEQGKTKLDVTRMMEIFNILGLRIDVR